MTMCENFFSKQAFVISEVARFNGVLVSSLPAVQYGRLFYRFFDLCKIEALIYNKVHFGDYMVFDDEALSEIKCWMTNINISYCLNKITASSLIVATDASQILVWGGIFNDLRDNGRWTAEESSLHINVLELKAILFSVQSLFKNSSDVHIRVRTDNSTAVAYINNLGDVKSIQCH